MAASRRSFTRRPRRWICMFRTRFLAGRGVFAPAVATRKHRRWSNILRSWRLAPNLANRERLNTIYSICHSRFVNTYEVMGRESGMRRNSAPQVPSCARRPRPESCRVRPVFPASLPQRGCGAGRGGSTRRRPASAGHARQPGADGCHAGCRRPGWRPC